MMITFTQSKKKNNFFYKKFLLYTITSGNFGGINTCTVNNCSEFYHKNS